MTADVAARGNHRKYIPVLARGSWRQAAPSWLKGKRYADLRTDATYRTNYPELADTLLGTTPTAPPIGRSSDSARRLSPNTIRRPTAEPTEPLPPRDGGVSSAVTHEEPIRIVDVVTDDVTAPNLDALRARRSTRSRSVSAANPLVSGPTSSWQPGTTRRASRPCTARASPRSAEPGSS